MRAIRSATRWIVEDARRRRVAYVALGVFGVAVPTAFTVLAAETSKLHVAIRLVLVVLWIVIVAVATWSAAKQQDRLQQSVELWNPGSTREQDSLDLNDEWSAREVVVADAAIRFLLASRWPGIPGHYRISAYLWDEDDHRLKPAYGEADSDDEVLWFEEGGGATGRAWADEDLIVARGEAVSDGQYGLTEAQQQRFADDQVVGAAPMWLNDQKVGVITAISGRDDGFLATRPGQQRLDALGLAIGLLIEAGWSHDPVQSQEEEGHEHEELPASEEEG